MNTWFDYIVKLFGDITSRLYLAVVAFLALGIILNLALAHSRFSISMTIGKAAESTGVGGSPRWSRWFNKFLAYVANVEPKDYSGTRIKPTSG
jgi:hypothetical protein